MGLDLEIRKKGKYHRTKAGKVWFRTTIVCDLRNCWSFLDNLNFTSNLENCSCANYTNAQLWEAAKSIEEPREKQYVIETLRDADIKPLKAIDEEETWYSVFAWW